VVTSAFNDNYYFRCFINSEILHKIVLIWKYLAFYRIIKFINKNIPNSFLFSIIISLSYFELLMHFINIRVNINTFFYNHI